MFIADERIEVEGPSHVAFDQWARFEEAPFFRGGVTEVFRLNEVSLWWRGEAAGVSWRLIAEVVGYEPNRMITLRFRDPHPVTEAIWFTPGDSPDGTIITMHVEMGALDAGTPADPPPWHSRDGLRADLRRFHDLLERRRSIAQPGWNLSFREVLGYRDRDRRIQAAVRRRAEVRAEISARAMPACDDEY